MTHSSSSTPAELAESFPADFAWGVATAAYQIEGAAQEGGRGPSIWDTFSHTPGLTHRGDTGDIACDHYHRWESDLDLMVSLGIRSYRLSLSWSRLQPTGAGALNPVAVEFYRNLLQGLKDREITPFVTLYHWDLPAALESEGGWANRQTAYLFGSYVGQVITELGALAEHWITLNEPWCSAFLGYGYGAHAPGRRDLRAATAAAHHLNLAHGLATAAIRDVAPEVRVGVTNIITDIVAATGSQEDWAAARRLDAVSNRVFMDPVYLGRYTESVHAALDPFGLRVVILDGDLDIIHAPVDFAGVNHYQRVIASHDSSKAFDVLEVPAEPATTSFGWSVLPDALHSVLTRVANEYTALPLYITESGASYDDYVDPNGEVVDTDRVDYLAGYFGAAARAIADGIDLRGYFVWSFLDNYEWAEGYSKRFGIVYVDYRTQARIPKHSARWYQSLITAHASLPQPTDAVV